VAAFWCKAQRVVAFKVRSEVEAKKKEVMDKQVRYKRYRRCLQAAQGTFRSDTGSAVGCASRQQQWGGA
jgi:hypothetical protein